VSAEGHHDHARDHVNTNEDNSISQESNNAAANSRKVNHQTKHNNSTGTATNGSTTNVPPSSEFETLAIDNHSSQDIRNNKEGAPRERNNNNNNPRRNNTNSNKRRVNNPTPAEHNVQEIDKEGGDVSFEQIHTHHDGGEGHTSTRSSAPRATNKRNTNTKSGHRERKSSHHDEEDSASNHHTNTHRNDTAPTSRTGTAPAPRGRGKQARGGGGSNAKAENGNGKDDDNDESMLVEQIALAGSDEAMIMDNHAAYYQGKRPPKSSSRLVLGSKSDGDQDKDQDQNGDLNQTATAETETAEPSSNDQSMPTTNTSTASPGHMAFTLNDEAAQLAFGKKKAPHKKPKRKKNKPKAKDGDAGEESEEEDVVEEGEEEANAEETVPAAAVPEESAVEQAIAALPGKEVSITASSSIRASSLTPNISRCSSATGLASVVEGVPSDVATDAAGGDTGVGATSTLKSGSGNKEKDKAAAASKKKKKGKKETSHGAKLFNRAVRGCVENSDPDAMRALLRNPENKHYALDRMVLETVMKAYVMAAMFEDANWCLHHNTMPGTLKAGQTLQILTCMPQNLRNSSAFTAADMINALSIATDFESPKKRTYFMRIVRGIALEFLEEATSARDRICSAPCERLVRSLLCVVDAQLKRGRKNGELIVVPGEQLGIYIPDNNFMDNRGIQSGDAVSILPYAGPYPMSAESLDRNMIEATVVNTQPHMVLKLQDKSNAALINMLTEPGSGNIYRVDKLANRMGFNRQLTAAAAFASPDESKGVKDSRRPCPELVQAITAMDENIGKVLQGASTGNYNVNMRDPHNKNSTADICMEAIPIWANDEHEVETEETSRDQGRILLEKHNVLEGLNASQRLAIEGASTNRLTLVQGPPGTGTFVYVLCCVVIPYREVYHCLCFTCTI
jgi:hypothetical protein